MNDLPVLDPQEPITRRSATVYEVVGPRKLLDLTEAFYHRVYADPFLRPMFPDDLEGAVERQFLFLVQFFGGPNKYTETRGHPMLRRRHFPFPIGMAERDAWLQHMLAAIAEVGIAEPEASVMRSYFESSSLAMINKA